MFTVICLKEETLEVRAVYGPFDSFNEASRYSRMASSNGCGGEHLVREMTPALDAATVEELMAYLP